MTNALPRVRAAFREANNYDRWMERGQITARERANTIWKRIVADYEQPPIDPGIDEALKDYMERRKREGGSPLN